MTIEEEEQILEEIIGLESNMPGTLIDVCLKEFERIQSNAVRFCKKYSLEGAYYSYVMSPFPKKDNINRLILLYLLETDLDVTVCLDTYGNYWFKTTILIKG